MSICTKYILEWTDIGFHFLVGEDGRIYKGRDTDVVAAFGDMYIHIAVIGNFSDKKPNLKAYKGNHGDQMSQ